MQTPLCPLGQPIQQAVLPGAKPSDAAGGGALAADELACGDGGAEAQAESAKIQAAAIEIG